ncbi:MAG: MiaB/RimO family radical SAM methylthiotransferase [Anaerolineae bacterium]|nr:MiaB/RimO family radical SAM methylthiotransferase [Anaerolineae bacterium]
MQIYLESLGCRLNAAEIENLARCFVGAGCSVCQDPEIADVIVLNTCAVTQAAAVKSRRRLRVLHRYHPRAQLAVLGCWATEAADRARQLPGVVWVLDNADKMRVVEIITGRIAPPVPWFPGRWGHTRAFLAVQEGCDYACTYCITRILRGRARSRALNDAIADVQDRVAHGAQEIVLTGVSLGAYGQDAGLEDGLALLSEAILHDTDLPRLRLSSVEPWDVTSRLLRLLAHPRFCRQLHLPLQSGSDLVLKRMGRRITTAQYTALVDAARGIAPKVAITTDIITGFPGETEQVFSTSFDFVKQMAFARLHVFPYSEREGTPATRLPGSVPHPVRNARASQMRALGKQLAAEYRAQFVGQVLPVLWERRCSDTGTWQGLTDTYVAVMAPSEADLYNRIVPARLLNVQEETILGAIVVSS